MPGLQLGGMAGVRASSGNGFSNPNPPSTATQAAFGTGSSAVGGRPSAMAALWPNDPFGVAFWTAVTAAGLLLLIRHSLPG